MYKAAQSPEKNNLNIKVSNEAYCRNQRHKLKQVIPIMQQKIKLNETDSEEFT